VSTQITQRSSDVGTALGVLRRREPLPPNVRTELLRQVTTLRELAERMVLILDEVQASGHSETRRLSLVLLDGGEIAIGLSKMLFNEIRETR